MAMHKSQKGTFDSIVYQTFAEIFIRLSRVIDIKQLYIVVPDNEQRSRWSICKMRYFL